MRFLSRYLPPFLIAWMATFSLASLLHSQFVVNELVAVGVQVSIKDRISLTIDDWVGLLPTYGIIIAIGLLIAFPIAYFIIQRIKTSSLSSKRWIYVAAGSVAIAVILLAMQPILGVTLIAGARELGFYAQLIAGAVGGAVFARYMRTS